MLTGVAALIGVNIAAAAAAAAAVVIEAANRSTKSAAVDYFDTADWVMTVFG